MKPKVIFVVSTQYTQNDHCRFGAEYFMNRGYPVEIWRKMTERSITLDGTILYRDNNYHEYDYLGFKRALENNMKGVFILFDVDNETIEFDMEIIERGCKYFLLMGLGGVYVSESTREAWIHVSKIFRAIIQGGLCSIIEKTRARLNNRYSKNNYCEKMKHNPPLLVVTSTPFIAKKYIPFNPKDVNIIYTHVWDYDRYIEEERKDDNSSEKFIVYCDSGFIFPHYDFASRVRRTDYCDEKRRKEHLEKLMVLMELLEKKFGVKSVVLGHPSCDYRRADFGNRKIVIGKTCEIIKKAKIFIVSCSNATQLAMLYDVPILKIADSYYKGISDSYYFPNAYEYIKREAKERYGCGFIDLDNSDAMKKPWEYAKRVAPKIREDFLRKHVSSRLDDKKTCIEYVEDFLRINHLINSTFEKMEKDTI